jgi:hypothetical protein
LNPFWPWIIKFRFWHSKFEAASRKLHWMKGFWTMRAQLCSQAVRAGGGGDGVGAGGGRGLLGLFELIILPLELVLRCLIPLASEATTKKVKTKKARKVIALEVFMVDFYFVQVKREAR